MKKYEKEILQAQLDEEKEVLEKLKKMYQKALDEINTKIAILLGRADSNQQYVIYQTQYQQALKKQIEAILETLHSNEFETVSEYLTKSYEDGYISTFYSLQQQGIPLVMPMDQEQIIRAIQTESKLSETLYKAFDMKDLQQKIAGEISRGIAGGMMYNEIARNIAGYAGISLNKAMRITKTESHRIQCKATMDACEKAKSKGADVVKQWDASLDKRTRASHRRVDGQIRELDEPFSNGLMYPGDSNGGASEVINCRCALLQRARWALDESELETLKKRAEYFKLDKSEDFVDYKKKYLKAVESERVRLSPQKISEKRKTSDNLFDTLNLTNQDSIRPYSVRKEIEKSEIGREMMSYLEEDNVPIKLCYGIDNPRGDLGIYDPFEDVIIIYCDKTKSIKETTKTLIHEATHRKLGSRGTFDEEVECYKNEYLHKKGKLTNKDIEDIIKLVKSNYPELE